MSFKFNGEFGIEFNLNRHRQRHQQQQSVYGGAICCLQHICKLIDDIEYMSTHYTHILAHAYIRKAGVNGPLYMQIVD